ncbi:MAG: iron-containing alcohol dehydrogenase [Bdellovibrionia bacterium]
MATYTFSFPTPIHFGPGIRKNLPGFFKDHGFRLPLIITDQGVVGLSFFQEIKASLEAGGLSVAVFSEITGNPGESQVIQGVNCFRFHNADSIIAIGGGAALDVAKAVALMVAHRGDLFDYEDGRADALPIDGPIPFWVAIPTTAGTGSEVGRSTVISDEKTHIKRIIFSPKLLAKAVFADPELALSMPASITAATGMDALTHCVESYLAKGYHPLCDGIALEGLKLAATHLEKCVREPNNIEARAGMLMSSIMGGIAFQKGLGLTHSCAHALSTIANLHHGLTNGLMINHALKFNISAVPERFHSMAVAIGLKNSTGEGFISWLEELKTQIGMPNYLSKAGLKFSSPLDQKFIDRVSTLAFEDSCHQNNPRTCTPKDFKQIFSEAL